MFQDIQRNKFKSGMIVFFFIFFITLLIYFICQLFDFGVLSIVIALIVSIVSSFTTYFYCDRIVLSACKARPATEEEDRKLISILDSLILSAGLSSKPKLYVVEDAQANAFATGRSPEHAVICVTTGLLEKLSYYELEGVVAHELGHIKNYDIRLSAILSVMAGFLVMLSDWFSRSIFWRGFYSDRDDRRSNSLLSIFGIILLALSPLFAKLIQLAVSRRREFLADATAVSFTRNPQGLISALEKLEADPNELKTASAATSHMYIAEPFRKSQNAKRRTSWFSTHPSIEDRIEALQMLK